MGNARVLPVLAVVVVVAAVLLGISVLRTLSHDPPARSGDAAGAPSRSAADTGEVHLDQGDVAPADVADCLVPEFAASADDVQVLYAERQSTTTGETAVLVLRNPAGDLRLCDVSGGDSPAEAPVPVADADDPVVFLSTGHARWTCTGDHTLDGFSSTTWLAVAAEVRTVQQRYWVDGVPGPWFTTEAQGGYAHLQSWLVGPEPAGSRYAVQYRVRDAAGAAVDQSALPTAKRRLPGCSSGGDAEIG